MSTALDDVIIERIGFLQEQLDIENNDNIIRNFQAQIKTLQTAQIDRLDELIQIRKTDLSQAKNVFDADSNVVAVWIRDHCETTDPITYGAGNSIAVIVYAK